MDTHRGETVPVWRDAFAKILALEEHKGFGDNAVSGGIRRFIERWEPELRACLDNDPHRVATLISAPYRELPHDARREWVSAWRSALADEAVPPGPESDRPPPTQPAEPAEIDPAPETSLFDTGDAFRHVPVRRRPHAAPKFAANPGDPDEPVSAVRRMDAKTVQRLESLGAGTVRDLLYMLPRRYDDRAGVTSIADVYAGGIFTLEGNLLDIRSANVGQRRLQLVEATLRDNTGAIDLQWFGQGFLARSLRSGGTMVVHGKAELNRGRLTIQSPEYDVVTDSAPPLNAGRVTPVYRLTQGMTARNLRSITWRALERFLSGVEEPMPADTLARTQLVGIQQALSNAHYPPDLLNADRARRRLAFDEILAFQMAILGRRRHRERDATGIAVQYSGPAVDGFLSELPFTPTRAQVRCIGEILADMARGTPPMSRLLQGEVGSGKTLVALTAILAAASDHRQSALMAPTEVLSEQHFATVARLLSTFEQPLQQPNVFSAYLPSLRRPFTVGLLTGSTRAAPRREVLRLASEGHLDLLIGTHALIQDGVELPNLVLAITDEQHRFGVAQRTALRGAGAEQPHALMMSATPIPRTLQLTLYGDLDVSTIDELPPGRQDILTRLVPEDKRAAAYGFVRQQVEAGRQAFVICPLVEESENLDVRAATEEHKRLSNEVFPDLKVGLLHGRLSSRDKDKVMRQFRDGDLDVLVATAVVEVGIDVPNATVMMIDGADRFGLAQLHQFRGRVGRGEHRSYCLLMSESESERARERLSALENNRDGFKLAEIDLQMRHEGDIFGTTQSGDQTILRIANVFDQDLMALARQEAAAILDADPELADPKHAGIAAERDRFLARVQDNISD
ncbi:MAG: ATP-dependent DNA helicase RecG [Chloroflexota bacterium]|nr:ATP-dependent DNA helicase RecG [Chloroflexota bacterium]MDE2958822.1 ATP-dependent DNA helicase RecG [Chloroflexota bacterium]